MHAILVTLGTDGDVFPYVGLGAHLRARGHRVTLVSSAQYEALAASHGLAFAPLVSSAEMHELLGHPDFWNPYKTATIAANWGVRYIERHYKLLAGLMQDKDSVLVANPGVVAALLVHEKSKRPLVHILLQPGMIPSSIAPPVMMMISFGPRTPRVLVRLFWRALDAVGDHLLSRHLNPIRTSLGLKPMKRFFSNWLAPQLVLGMFPEWYGPPQTDWPSQVRLTGFPIFDGGTARELPPEVRDFCRTGEPPVAFTFGTGMMHADKLFRTSLEACELLGQRAIFLTKYRQQLPLSLPSSILHCPFAPFGELFPLCAAVVHHGGIGTTARALATGTPQLVLPICFDQMDNAARVERIGAGRSIKSRGCTSEAIAAELSHLVKPEFKSRCQAQLKQFNHADAFATATRLIEGLADAH